eukprot:Rmarinus@m.23886
MGAEHSKRAANEKLAPGEVLCESCFSKNKLGHEACHMCGEPLPEVPHDSIPKPAVPSKREETPKRMQEPPKELAPKQDTNKWLFVAAGVAVAVIAVGVYRSKKN